jgi:hypothetical protein
MCYQAAPGSHSPKLSVLIIAVGHEPPSHKPSTRPPRRAFAQPQPAADWKDGRSTGSIDLIWKLLPCGNQEVCGLPP